MSLVGRFFRDSGIYGLATILSKGLTVLLVPVYTALLSRGEVGLLDLLLGVIALGSLLVGLDISNALAREYGDAHEADLRRRYSSTALWFSVAMFAMVAILGVWGAPAISAWLFREIGPGAVGPVRAAMVSMAISGVYLVVVQQLRWMLQPVRYGIVSIGYTVLSLTGTIVLAGPVGLGVSGVFFGMSLGALGGLVMALVFSRGEFGWSFDWRLLRKMLGFCLPLVPSSLAIVTGQYVSRLFIERNMGLDAVGVYGIGLRIAGLMGLVMLGFGSALTPLIYAHQKDPETPAHLARIFHIFVGLASVGLGTFVLFVPEIMALLARGDYGAARPVLVWLAPAVLLSQMYIFAPGPWIARKTTWVAGINVSTAVAAVILNAVLVPRWGIVGAAWATLACAAANFLISLRLSQRLYPVPHGWGRLSMMLVPGIVVMVLGAWLPGELEWGWILFKAGLAMLLALSVLLIGDLPWREAVVWVRARAGHGRRSQG